MIPKIIFNINSQNVSKDKKRTKVVKDPTKEAKKILLNFIYLFKALLTVSKRWKSKNIRRNKKYERIEK